MAEPGAFTCHLCKQTFSDTTAVHHRARVHQQQCIVTLTDGRQIVVTRDKATGCFICPSPTCEAPNYQRADSRTFRSHILRCYPTVSVQAAQPPLPQPAHVPAYAPLPRLQLGPSAEDVAQTSALPQPQPLPSRIAPNTASAWQERKRDLAFSLRNGTRAKLAALAQSARSASESTVQSTVLQLLHAGSSILPNVPQHVLRRLVSLTDSVDASSTPFVSVSAENLHAGADIWNRVMLFLLRAYEQCSSENQARAKGLLPAWSVLASMDVATRASIPRLCASDAASRQAAMLSLTAFCVQPSSSVTQDSALIVAFACICVGEADEWRPSTEVLGVSNVFAYCIRLFSLLLHLQQWSHFSAETLTLTEAYSNLRSRSDAWEAFEDRHAATLVATRNTVMRYLASIFVSVTAAQTPAVADAGAAPTTATSITAPRKSTEHSASGGLDGAVVKQESQVSSHADSKPSAPTVPQFVPLQPLAGTALGPQPLKASTAPQHQAHAAASSSRLPSIAVGVAKQLPVYADRPVSSPATATASTSGSCSATKAHDSTSTAASRATVQRDVGAFDVATSAAALMDPRRWLRKSSVAQSTASSPATARLPPTLASLQNSLNEGPASTLRNSAASGSRTFAATYAGPDTPPQTPELEAVPFPPTCMDVGPNSTSANHQDEDSKKRKRFVRAPSAAASAGEDSEFDELEEEPSEHAAALLGQAQANLELARSPAKRTKTVLCAIGSDDENEELLGAESSGKS